MGSRVRVWIAVAAAMMVTINLLVLLYLGPEVAEVDRKDPDLAPKDDGEGPDVPEEPEVYEIEESQPPGDEKG